MKPKRQYYDSGKPKSEYYYDDNGYRHNPHGPAIRNWDTYGNLIEVAYYYHGRLHRTDGPASIIYNTETGCTTNRYYIHGNRFTKDDFYKTALDNNWITKDEYFLHAL